MEDKNAKRLFFERKEKLVLKEFDTGFSSYQKIENKVSSLRQWTITINVGFVIFTLDKCNTLTPELIVIFLFMFIILVHELRERASMKFNKNNILELEKIFNINDQEQYERKILDYKFRDEIISQLNAKTKLKHYWNSLHKGEVILWYGMWMIVWMILILIKRWNTIFSKIFSFNSIFFFVILFLAIFFGISLILKYFNLIWLLKNIWKEIITLLKRLNIFRRIRRKKK